ncbi:hypothetical protein Acr_28g0005340 [Actinidia rufa]|uniref:Uncharacterized protein n=1 Tax=Actinidia rufa TaxID=165716 RepID=A0A7J0H9T1_9ERIC|nr:hypothetical protein Acr_28g0005340 [Actinidia rufa]
MPNSFCVPEFRRGRIRSEPASLELEERSGVDPVAAREPVGEDVIAHSFMEDGDSDTSSGEEYMAPKIKTLFQKNAQTLVDPLVASVPPAIPNLHQILILYGHYCSWREPLESFCHFGVNEKAILRAQEIKEEDQFSREADHWILHCCLGVVEQGIGGSGRAGKGRLVARSTNGCSTGGLIELGTTTTSNQLTSPWYLPKGLDGAGLPQFAPPLTNCDLDRTIPNVGGSRSET